MDQRVHVDCESLLGVGRESLLVSMRGLTTPRARVSVELDQLRPESARRPAWGSRAELFSARPVVEGFSAMLDFGQFGVDLDNHVLDIDVRR